MELNRTGRLVDALALCDLGYVIAEELEDASMERRGVRGDVMRDALAGTRHPGSRSISRPSGAPVGVDVVGKQADGDGVEVISCKCRVRIKAGELAQWSDDFLNHWKTHWEPRRVRRFVLSLAADVKSKVRNQEVEAEKARFAAVGVEYEI